MPGYWMAETSGRLRPAVEAYLHGEPMTADQIGAIREYLRQWIAPDIWREAEALRAGINELVDRAAITRWLDDALAIGIDPL